MIPGFSNALMPPGHEKESQGKIKRFMTIMDSMTDKELDSVDPKLLVVSPADRSRHAALLTAHAGTCNTSADRAVPIPCPRRPYVKRHLLAIIWQSSFLQSIGTLTACENDGCYVRVKRNEHVGQACELACRSRRGW